MPRNLSYRAITRLKPRAQQFEVMDAAFPGFGVIIYPSGAKSYVYRFRDQLGRLRRDVLGPVNDHLPLGRAREMYRDAKGARDAGLDPIAMKHEARAQKRAALEQDSVEIFTVGKLVDLYLAACKQQREVGEKSRVLNHEDYAAMRKLEALRVTRHDAIEALARVRSRAKVQYNRTRSYFRAMFEWGMTELRELDGLAGNPFARVPIEKAAENKKDRALSFSELVALHAVLDGADDRQRANVLRIVALTGLRPGYVCSLQWRWLELEGETPVLRLPKTKNERAYTVRLSKQVADLLGTIHRGRSSYVFNASTKAGYLDKRSVAAFVRDDIAPRVKVEGKVIAKWTPHDLRRSVGTRLQQLGYRKELIDAAVLHHVEPGVKGTYLRYEYEEEGGVALQHLATHLESLRSATNVVSIGAGRGASPPVAAR